MNVSVCYLRVFGENRGFYLDNEKRFLATYEKFKPVTPHELVIVNNHAPEPGVSVFDCVATKYAQYDGNGWDCGCWLHLSRTMDTDLLVCLNSTCYFWKHGWLERLVEAVTKYGKGLYGTCASYQITPHIRTPCYTFQPEVMRGYPYPCDDRPSTYRFEHGSENFTKWVMEQGHPAILVTWDGCYEKPDWRKPPNIFRRGDQSNLLVIDKHCDNYTASDEQNKRQQEREADYG